MDHPEEKVILKPRNDKRDYRWIQLPNEMQVLLISDVDTDKAAASMDVNVGYFCDPDDLPGLAHFLEHMLFYSSEKYPKEDSYSKFIGEHGGRSNAYTTAEHTNFQFDINYDHLEEALDRFAQFFLCPLFSADATSREIKSVDSENSKNLTSDLWRLNQLQKHISSRKHPYHKFGTGNLKTLKTDPESAGVDVRQRMIDFYNDHYSANLMRLVVYGREPLDVLQNIVTEKFSGVRNTVRRVPEFPGQPCEEDHLKIIIKAVPVTEGHSLELSWTSVPEFRHYKAAPSRYISHLLGHEGDGSLFALLKSLEKMEEVVGLIWQYIRILQKQGVEEWIFEEERAVCETKFHFRDMIQPFQYVTMLSANLQIYPPEDCIAGPLLPRYFDRDLINETLARLTVDNVRMMWCSKDFEGQTTAIEPWYGTGYSIVKVSDETVERWTSGPVTSELHLPAPNLFIPTDFSLKEPFPETKYPVLCRESGFSRLWYKPDAVFRTPKAYVCIDFMCPESYTSPENSILTRIFTKLLIDYLNEYAYYAEVAGLAYSVEHSVSGFLVTVTGYNHKLLALLEMIIEKITNFQVNKERFDILKEKVNKDFQNFKYEQPYQHALYTASVILEHKRWHMHEYLAVIPDLEAEDLCALFPKLLSRMFLECFVTGNLSVSEAESLVERVEKLMATKPKLKLRALFPSQHLERRIIKLDAGSAFSYSMPCSNPSNENSALQFYLQVGQDKCRLNVLGQLFVQTAKRDAYYQLRSIEQLGYIVFLLPRNDFGVTGMQLVLQSNLKDAATLEMRVEAFLSSFGKKLLDMPEKEFQDHVDALIAIKLERHKNLSEEASYHWREIDYGTFQFDRRDREVAALREVKKADLLDFYASYVAPGGSQRRKLSIRVNSILAAKKQSADRSPSPLSNGGGAAIAVVSAEEGPASAVPNGGLVGTSPAGTLATDDAGAVSSATNGSIEEEEEEEEEGSYEGRQSMSRGGGDEQGNPDPPSVSDDSDLACQLRPIDDRLMGHDGKTTPSGTTSYEETHPISNIYSWKRSQQLYESLKGRHPEQAVLSM
ncbi:hypothetical protein CBR_g12082 [Chara braunii]|uniref:Peptidase M16 N-terminal domain-containing protein n=1 Tax=Chara braunii TaxID=69332 RepID=A0A388KR14_CHABU|nr:hypothetical protein CBR_g12082 [Chara braunii]|eukprot:GBG72511.1 hypothetical protein CBR_g12082 [Chara braunii]